MTDTLPSTEVLSAQDVTKLLQGAGFLESDGPSSGIQRIKLNGLSFEVGDEVYFTHPKNGTPAFIAQIVDMPKQYQARYFDSNKLGDVELLNRMNRTHLSGSFCKSYFDEPLQARNKNQKGDSCRDCLVNPFVPKAQVPPEADGKKCQWRGEVTLRILEQGENGSYTAPSEDVALLDLSTTGMMEWQGLSSDPVKGYVSELNFMQKLAALAQKKYADNPQAGILKALTALKLGGVIAEVRALQASSGSANFTVVSFTPIDIIEDLTAERTAIESTESDELPF